MWVELSWLRLSLVWMAAYVAQNLYIPYYSINSALTDIQWALEMFLVLLLFKALHMVENSFKL